MGSIAFLSQSIAVSRTHVSYDEAKQEKMNPFFQLGYRLSHSSCLEQEWQRTSCIIQATCRIEKTFAKHSQSKNQLNHHRVNVASSSSRHWHFFANVMMLNCCCWLASIAYRIQSTITVFPTDNLHQFIHSPKGGGEDREPFPFQLIIISALCIFGPQLEVVNCRARKSHTIILRLAWRVVRGNLEERIRYDKVVELNSKSHVSCYLWTIINIIRGRGTFQGALLSPTLDFCRHCEEPVLYLLS